MFTIKTLTVKNFMSVGNSTQAVKFDKSFLTLVLGQNLDLGGDDTGARNGTGKTTIVNALSYGLFGDPLTNIRRDNLINKTNGKAMLVTLEFDCNGNAYKIERGRKPNVLKFYVNDQEQEIVDEAQGDSRETQEAINKLLGMSHLMFKHVVALNTYTEPFLSMKANDQREIIEQLLGVTLLSEKAETLKAQIKDSKALMAQEEYQIDAAEKSNVKIQETIASLETRKKLWYDQRDKDVIKLDGAIAELEQVDIDSEISAHKQLEQWNENSTAMQRYKREMLTLEQALERNSKQVTKINKDLEYAKDAKCPTCEQELHDDKHQALLEELQHQHDDSMKYQEQVTYDISKVQKKIDNIGDVVMKPDTYYDSAEQAYNHKSTMAHLKQQLEDKALETDPYTAQIVDLQNEAIQEVNWDKLNQISKLKDHQEFLYKLLTSKDSFIRKRIIDQNLAFLNQRLAQYLQRIGLPHTVKFLNDLTVEIQELGRDLDFDNLSRGERNRLILSLSWSFRDVWESLYTPVNLLFVDELIDNGLDASGVESALGVLKQMARERNKNVFLISHKDELQGRVNNTLNVIKENGYTSYSNDVSVQ